MDRLILVNEKDEIIGYESKEKCHDGDGILHRAFSIFIFNSEGRLLIQRRSRSKRLWPLFWSNTCCSHPRENENYLDAGHRRLPEETGLKTSLTQLYTFPYFARYPGEGSERELCAVMIGKSDEKPVPNPDEINEWSYIPVAQLLLKMQKEPELFTPWFHLECTELFGPRLEQVNEILQLDLMQTHQTR